MTDLTQQQTLPTASRPYAIFKPNEGRTLKVFEATITYKSSISDIQGWRFFEVVGSGNGGPLHTHPWGVGMYILEGEVEVQLGDQFVLATPGYCIHIPAGTVHTYQIRSPQAKFFGWFPDTRAEHCFEELAQVVHPTPEAIAAIGQKHYIIPAENIARAEIKRQLPATVFKPNEGKCLSALGSQVTYKSAQGNGWRFFKVNGSVGGQTPLHTHNQELLNERFTNTEIQKAINAVPFPVVHLATHGVFNSNLEDTFLLTWNDRINVNQLGKLLQSTELGRRRPIELLVLSACETAEGDNRAALGLAGIAVQAGARSTVATLWQVNDEAMSIFMQRFYHELIQPNATKANALRQAQLSLLRGAGDPQYAQPYYWSPVILVGNWQ